MNQVRQQRLESALGSHDLTDVEWLMGDATGTLADVLAEYQGIPPRFIIVGRSLGDLSGYWLKGFETAEEAGQALTYALRNVPGVIEVVWDLDDFSEVVLEVRLK